jgi:hypothetical protein
MSLAEHFDICDRCDGYVISGTLKRTGMALNSRCRCNDEPWEQRVEQEIRERQAQPLPDERAQFEPKELPNGRFQVAA